MHTPFNSSNMSQDSVWWNEMSVQLKADETELLDKHLENQYGTNLQVHFSKVTQSTTETSLLVDTVFEAVKNGIINRTINHNDDLEVKLWQTANVILADFKSNRKNSADKNLGLSEDSFNNLLKELLSGNNKLFNKLVADWINKLIKLLKKHYPTADFTDIKEAVLSAFEDFWTRTIQGKVKYGNLKWLLMLIAKQHYLKILKKNNNFTVLPDSFDVLDIDTDWADLNMLQRLDVVMLQFKEKQQQCFELLCDTFYNKKRVTDILSKYDCKDANSFGKKKSDCLKKMRKLFFHEHKN